MHKKIPIMWIAIYNLIICALGLIVFPFAVIISIFSEKLRQKFWPRLGVQNFPENKKPLWVHALSVGEINAAAPLVLGLVEKFPDMPIVISASTKTGFEIAQKLLGHAADHIFYFPYDLPFCVSRAISRVDPLACVLVESDIWPNFVWQIKRKNIPLILANARLSDSSFAGYARLKFLMGPVFNAFDAICVQSEHEKERFAAIGADVEKIFITGNLKFDMAPSPVVNNEFNFSDRKVIVAGSTHPGEESHFASLLGQWKKLRDIRLVVAPRDPRRARAVEKIFLQAGFSTRLFSQGQELADVIIVDEMGVLTKIYSMATLCFVGGSLKSHGGHNPLEPAMFGKPVLFGPDMGDFPQISTMLVQGNGAWQISDANELGNAVTALLKDPQKAAQMGKNALGVVKANQGSVKKTLTIMESYYG